MHKKIISKFIKGSADGFTIVELLVVIVVIAILAAITLVSYGSWKTKTSESQLKSDLNGVASAMENARNFGTGYPATVPATFVPSSGVTLNGGSLLGGKSFCVTATNSKASYNITQDKVVLAGPCSVFNIDVGSKLSYSGSGTTINDLSGNGNDGVINGAGYNNANGGVLVFDSSSEVVNIPDSASIDLTTSITIDMWIYPTAEFVGYAAHPITKWSSTTDANFVLYYFGTSSGTSRNLVFYANSGGSWQGISPAYQAPLNQWTHIVFTYSSTSGGKQYINGSLNGSTATLGVLATNNTAMTIGESFPGKIGQVRIYNKVLSENDVKIIYETSRSRYGL